MGFFDDFLGGTGGVGSWVNPGTLLGGPLGGLIYGEKGLDVTGGGARGRLSEYEQNMARLRGESKQKQLQMLSQLKSPTVTPQMEARIRALEEESKAGPLSQDPYFQGARANLVGGGARELASVAGKQRAYDVSGGFKNTGSLSDVYDRLGAQLAQLGQRATDVKAQKRDAASELRQGIADAQLAYENEILRAQMAIEAGDAAAAQDAMGKAYAAREAIRARQQSLFLGAGQMALGAVTGNPLAAAGGAKQVAGASSAQPTGGMAYGNENYWQGQVDSPLGVTYNDRPWSVMRRSS